MGVSEFLVLETGAKCSSGFLLHPTKHSPIIIQAEIVDRHLFANIFLFSMFWSGVGRGREEFVFGEDYFLEVFGDGVPVEEVYAEGEVGFFEGFTEGFQYGGSELGGADQGQVQVGVGFGLAADTGTEGSHFHTGDVYGQDAADEAKLAGGRFNHFAFRGL